MSFFFCLQMLTGVQCRIVEIESESVSRLGNSAPLVTGYGAVYKHHLPNGVSILYRMLFIAQNFVNFAVGHLHDYI